MRAVVWLAAWAMFVPASAWAGGDVTTSGSGSRGAGGGSGSGREWSTWGEVALPEGLSLEVIGGGDEAGAGLWAVLHNDGAEPVTLATDARLADVELRAGRTRARCPSPDPIEPPGMGGAESTTIPAGGTAQVPIDLLYHCWDDLGRVRRAADGGPVQVGVTYGVVLVDPELETPIGRAGALSATAELPLPPAADPGAGTEGEALVVEAGDLDVRDGTSLLLRVTVRNRSGDAVKLVDHPTQFRFRVSGPTGEWECSMAAWRIRPLPDLLVRVRRGGKYEKRLDLAMYCPGGAFAKAGVYRVVPTYDPYLAERASEAVVDRPIDGAPVAVRVRQGGD